LPAGARRFSGRTRRCADFKACRAKPDVGLAGSPGILSLFTTMEQKMGESFALLKALQQMKTNGSKWCTFSYSASSLYSMQASTLIPLQK
jgi:hypothetical protein